MIQIIVKYDFEINQSIIKSLLIDYNMEEYGRIEITHYWKLLFLVKVSHIKEKKD